MTSDVPASTGIGTFLLYLSAIYVALLLAMAPVVWIDAAHHDNTRYLNVTTAPEYKADCNSDPQYKWLRRLGRPLAASIECTVFRNTRTLQDLGRMRAAVIGVLALAAAVLALMLTFLGVDRISAGFIAAAVFTLPGFQNAAFMTNFPNALTPLLCLSAYFFLIRAQDSRSSKIPRIVVALGLLLVAMFVYPALTFVFFWGTAAQLLTDRSTRSAGPALIAARDGALFAVPSLLYVAITKLATPDMYRGAADMPVAYQADLSVMSLLRKTPFVFGTVLPKAASLWSVPLGWVSFVILILLVLGTLLLLVERRLWLRPVFLFLVLLLTTAPVLLTKSPLLLQRLLLPVKGAFVIALALLLALMARYLAKAGARVSQTGVAIMAVVGLVTASQATALNVWNTNTEMQFVRNELARYNFLPRRIHLVTPVRNELGYNGHPTWIDEFNRKTTDYDWTLTDFTRIALFGSWPHEDAPLIARCDFNTVDCEAVVPQRFMILSVSRYGEPVCRSAGMVVVDMNVLVRATRTGAPGVVNPATLPPCPTR